MSRLSIIGCGNSNRFDDGVGVHIIQRLDVYLRANPSIGVSIFDSGTAGIDVMFKARGCDALIIVDANRSGAEPGSIFEVPGEEFVNIPDPGLNLHGFRWDHALYVARKIFGDEFPSDITVFLIEAENLSLGIGLTPRVSTAADKVFALLVERIKSHSS